MLVHLPFAVVMLVAAVGFLRVYMAHWREGATLLGGALLLAALGRAVLSDEQVGLLAIRRKLVDVLLYAALGALIVMDAVTITGGPFD